MNEAVKAGHDGADRRSSYERKFRCRRPLDPGRPLTYRMFEE